MAEDGPSVLINEREVVEEEFVKRVNVLAVPESQKFPRGIKYRMHDGRVDGETILRYDNSHGTHERHRKDGVQAIDFPGLEALYRRFTDEIED